MADGRPRWVDSLAQNIVLRVVAYYALLAAMVVLLARLFPGVVEGVAVMLRAAPSPEGAALTLGRGELGGLFWNTPSALPAAVAMFSACLLALPVAWIYVLTRRKKGYRQSVVQTLVILPVVVAGVVVLVKSSLALAFSLAGIVAAVRFRNTLEDSKDAVYIFLATGIGLASGVDLGVAIALSVLFNGVILVLWTTDFGRSPAALEGRRAERQLQRAMAIVNRTGTFVAKIDDEVLEGMAPEQLDALADRAWRRRKRSEATGSGGEDVARPEYDTLVRVRTTDPSAARALLDAYFEESVRQWCFGHVLHEPGGEDVVEYSVRRPSGVSRDELANRLRALQSPALRDVEVR